jgi:hypothetical protein
VANRIGLSGFEGIGGIAGRGAERVSATAVLCQIGEQIVHRTVFGRVDELPTQPPLRDKAGMNEMVQVEGERGRKDAKTFRDHTGREPFRADRDEQPKEVETRFLAERSKGDDCSSLFHRRADPLSFRRASK